MKAETQHRESLPTLDHGGWRKRKWRFSSGRLSVVLPEEVSSLHGTSLQQDLQLKGPHRLFVILSDRSVTDILYLKIGSNNRNVAKGCWTVVAKRNNADWPPMSSLHGLTLRHLTSFFTPVIITAADLWARLLQEDSLHPSKAKNKSLVGQDTSKCWLLNYSSPPNNSFCNILKHLFQIWREAKWINGARR